MRKYIELKIDGINVDLPPDGFSVSLSYRVADGYLPSGSSSERSIDLPLSKNNVTALGELGDFKPVQLFSDGITILTGQAQSKEHTLSANNYDIKARIAKVALYGSSADWITLLGDKALSDLDWSSDEHTLLDANVLSKYAAIYPISNYGYSVWKLKDWSYYSGSFAVSALDSHPVIFVRTLLDKIFNELGYTYSSTFFDSVVGKHLAIAALLPSRYPAEFAQEYLNGFWERTLARTYTMVGIIGVIEGLDFTAHTAPPKAPDPFANSVLYSGSLAGEYTPKISGYYKISYSVTVDNFTGGVTTFQLSVAAQNATLVGALPGVNVVAGDTITGSYIVYATVNEPFYIRLYSTLGDGGAGDTFDVTAARVEVFNDTAEITIGAPIDFKYLLHDWTCRDFLKGLTHALNLRFETDATTQDVRIEPADDYLYNDPAEFGVPAGATVINTGFYTGTQPVKWDLSKEHSDEFNDIGNVTIIKYKEDSNDATVKALQESGKYTLYECRYNRTTDRFKIDEDEFENPFFAPTMHVFDASVQASNSLITPQIPLLFASDYLTDPTNEDRVETYEPRLLYFAGIRSDIYIDYYDHSTTTVTQKRIPECFMVNYNNTDGTDFSLSFDNQSINGNDVIGLTRRFYLAQLARTRKSIVRVTWAYFRALDILNLTFRPKIILGNKQYILQELSNYNPLSIESSKLELILDEPDTADDVTALEFADIVGYVGDVGEEV